MKQRSPGGTSNLEGKAGEYQGTATPGLRVLNCGHCGGALVDALVKILPGPRLHPARVVVDPHGDRIKVKCGSCNRFYGYKPVKEMRANGNG